jgi:hypothetical protein
MAKATRPIPVLSESDKQRFFSKISTTPTENGCLEWMAGGIKDGYGVFGLSRDSFLAHRIAYFLDSGTDPVEMCVCHSCDNPKCVNPEHLFLGTDDDNVQDKMRKGRANFVRGDEHWTRLYPEKVARGDRSGKRTKPESQTYGEDNPASKLTTVEVMAIRLDPRTLKAVAADYGVAFTTIHKIKKRQIWKQIA